MAQEVGVAYVTLLPSAKGFGKAVEGQLDSAASGHEKAQQSLWGKVAKWGGVAAAAIGGFFVAKVLQGGISRALNIEDAQAKLKGLGHDTQAVEAIMKDALAAVKGTAFGLDSAATIAASAVVAGIKPGQELERYLRLTADAATIAGVSLEEMGSILNKVTAKGVAQMDDMNRLTERNIPILQWLADEYGVTAEELSKMVSRGEVDAETFRRVIEENIGGAALASGETVRSAWANVKTAFSRLGALVVAPALGPIKEIFGEIIIGVDGVADKLGPFVDKWKGWLESLSFEGAGDAFLGWLDEVAAYFTSGDGAALVDAGRQIWDAFQLVSSAVRGPLVDAVAELMAVLSPVLAEVVSELAPVIAEELLPAFSDLLIALIPLLPALADLAAAVLPGVAAAAGDLAKAVSSAEGQQVIGWIADLIEFLGTPTGDVLRDVAEFFSGLGPAGPLIGDAVEQLASLFDGARHGGEVLINAAAMFEDFWTAATAPAREAEAIIRDAMSIIGSILETAWSGIQAAAGLGFEQLGLMIGGNLQFIIGLITGDGELMVKGAEQAVGAIRTVFDAGWAAVSGVASQAWAGLVGIVVAGVTSAVAAVQSLPDRARGALANIGSVLYSSGRDFIQGFIRGVEDMARRVADAATSVVANAVDGVKSWLGIASPSKVARYEIAHMWGEGMILGFEDIAPRVESSWADLTMPSASGAAGVGPSFEIHIHGDLVDTTEDDLFRMLDSAWRRVQIA